MPEIRFLVLTAGFIAVLFLCSRLPAHSRGSALRGFTATEEDQAREEIENLVSEVICLSIWYVNVVFPVHLEHCSSST